MENIEINGKVVGCIYNGTYISERKPEHFMWKFQGYGISEDVLQYLNKNNIKKVKIIYYGKLGKKILTAMVDDYFKSSKTHNFILPNGKNDKQYFLSEKEMILEDSDDKMGC